MVVKEKFDKNELEKPVYEDGKVYNLGNGVIVDMRDGYNNKIIGGLVDIALDYMRKYHYCELVDTFRDEKGRIGFKIVDTYGRFFYLVCGRYFVGPNRRSKTINREIVELAIKEHAGILFYLGQDDITKRRDVYWLEPDMIKATSENGGNLNDQKMWLIDFQYAGAININLLARPSQNLTEALWTSRFMKDFPNKIIYTGLKTSGFRIGEKIPDWKVDGQNKVIEFCGTYWHSPEEIEQRVKYFKEQGFETFVITEKDKHPEEILKKISDWIGYTEERRLKEEKAGLGAWC